jgi:hypothetical protein
LYDAHTYSGTDVRVLCMNHTNCFHALSDIESDSDDGSNERAVAPAVPTATSTDGGEEEAATSFTERPAEVAPEVSKARKALIAKMRENAYEARRKKVELQELNLTKMWPYLTDQMSPSSLAKVRGFPGYEEAKVSRQRETDERGSPRKIVVTIEAIR